MEELFYSAGYFILNNADVQEPIETTYNRWVSETKIKPESFTEAFSLLNYMDKCKKMDKDLLRQSLSY